jgi:hypothetical protein
MKRIPTVKRWRVRYVEDDGSEIVSFVVNAPTRLFARWAAHDLIRSWGLWRAGLGRRVVISVKRQPETSVSGSFVVDHRLLGSQPRAVILSGIRKANPDDVKFIRAARRAGFDDDATEALLD